MKLQAVNILVRHGTFEQKPLLGFPVTTNQSHSFPYFRCHFALPLLTFLYKLYHTACSLIYTCITPVCWSCFPAMVLLSSFLPWLVNSSFSGTMWTCVPRLYPAGSEPPGCTDASSTTEIITNSTSLNPEKKLSKWWLIREINKIWSYLKIWWLNRTISMLLIPKGNPKLVDNFPAHMLVMSLPWLKR